MSSFYRISLKKETGKRIAEIRKSAGDTQQSAAVKLGIGRTALANYESGTSQMPDTIRDKFVKIYNTSHDFLMGRSSMVAEPSSDYASKSLLELIDSLESNQLTDIIRKKVIELIDKDSEQKQKIITLHEYKDDLVKILRGAGYNVPEGL